MIKNNNPEINVEELMQRIRAEVAQRRSASGMAETRMDADSPGHAYGAGNTSSEELRTFTINPPEFYPVAVQPAFQPKTDGQYHFNELLCYHDQAFINVAYNTVLRRAPDTDGYLHYLNMLRNGCAKVDILGRLRYSKEGRATGIKISGLAIPFLLQQVYRIPVFGRFVQILSAIWHLPHLERNQRAFENHTILLMEQAQSHFSESCRSLNQSLVQLEQGIRQLHDFAMPRADQAAINEATVANFSLIQKSVEELQNSKAGLDDIEIIKGHIQNLKNSKANQSALNEARHLFTQAIETRAERHELTALTNHLVSLVEPRLKKEDLQPVEQLLDQLKQHVEELSRSRAARSEFEAEQTQTRSALDALQQNVQQALNAANKLHDTKASQSALDEAMLTEDDHRLDAMYASFEDRFRGTREDIKQRQSIYLPIVLEAKAGSKDAPILDLGCGRGEWLEFLRDEGFTARGVDINRIFLAGCRKLELDVVEQDAVGYLRTLNPNSIGAVTAFHLIEHLPLKTLIVLLDESLRVLKPGGLVILETPNPENVLVGSSDFYFDPTHRNPLPGPLTQFLLEVRGFSGTSFMPLHPYESSERLTEGSPQVQRVFNQFFFGPQDYAVVAYKPKS